MKIRNIKNCKAWCWQEKRVMRIIQKQFKGKRLTTCRAIYQSLTELASNHGSDVFSAYHSQIAEFAGKSISTVKNYCKELIKLGLLERKIRKKGKINLSNEWKLLTPSVNNNYPTSVKNNYSTSGKNISLQVRRKSIKKKKLIKKKCTRTYSSVKDITDEEMHLLAQRYQVPIAFVRSKYEDLINYCEAKGKRYKNYLAALRNFVKQDAIKTRKEALGDPRERGVDATKLL